MPKTLREGGRRLKHEITLEGHQHEFTYVVTRCQALVHEESKAAKTPALVLTPDDLATHGLDALSRSTGMLLAAPDGIPGLAATGGGGSHAGISRAGRGLRGNRQSCQSWFNVEMAQPPLHGSRSVVPLPTLCSVQENTQLLAGTER
jgi:hypothetical protein